MGLYAARGLAARTTARTSPDDAAAPKKPSHPWRFVPGRPCAPCLWGRVYAGEFRLYWEGIRAPGGQDSAGTLAFHVIDDQKQVRVQKI